MRKQVGFTIVELLVVIVVIAILAAITIVAYNGIQQRSRDAIRVSDLKGVQKALELFNVDQGRYPATPGGPTWDDHWGYLQECIKAGTNCGFTTSNYKAVASSVPNDPQDNPSTSSDSDPTYYFGYGSGSAGSDRYILRGRLESSSDAALTNDADGDYRAAGDNGCADPWYCIKYNVPVSF